MKQITVRLTNEDYVAFKRVKYFFDEKKNATALRQLIHEYLQLHQLFDSMNSRQFDDAAAIRYLEKRVSDLSEELKTLRQ